MASLENDEEFKKILGDVKQHLKEQDEDRERLKKIVTAKDRQGLTRLLRGIFQMLGYIWDTIKSLVGRIVNAFIK